MPGTRRVLRPGAQGLGAAPHNGRMRIRAASSDPPAPGSLPSDLRARAPREVRRAVAAELERMERAEDVRVLLAVESGSRAWGFASPDSDFDVRFVYVRPVEHYLRLEPARDVLEWRVDEVLDVDGWDADKALRLLRGSNPSLFEWLASPIVYAEDPAFAVVRELAAECFSPVASAHHYLSMGRNHLAALAGETVRLKKCLYTMRAILAARWVVAERAPAPMLLRDLVDAELEESMKGLAAELLEAKAAGGERGERPRIAAFNAWAAGALAQVTGALADLEPPAPVPWERLDEVFLALVGPAACRSMSERLLHGKPVTDERIRMWADEAEAGYDPATLPKPRRGRPPVGGGPGVVPVRFDAATLAALNARAQAEGIQNRSEAIRAAVRAWAHIA